VRRSNLLVLLGIAFFVVGGIIVLLITSGDDGGGSGGTSKAVVVVPTEDVSAGTLADDLIKAGKLKEVEIPVSDVVPGAIQSLNQMAGATFTQGFGDGQQLLSTGLQLQTRTFDVPKGFEAVAVQLDFVGGGAGYVNPGDKINLYAVLQTAAGAVPVPRAELLLTNVEVLDVNLTIPPRRGTGTSAPADATSAARPAGSEITYLLALRTDDAEKIVYMTEFQKLYASLPAKDAPPAGPTPGRDGGNILSEEPNDAFKG
jgi:Flp pilus assembly protein CpaB